MRWQLSPRPRLSDPIERTPDMTSFIQNLRLAHRLLLLGLIAMLLVAVPLTTYVRGALADLDTIANERAGLAPTRALLEVVRLSQIHRGMTATVLGGKTDAEPQRQTRADELQQAMQRFDALLVRDIEDERIRAGWQR